MLVLALQSVIILEPFDLNTAECDKLCEPLALALETWKNKNSIFHFTSLRMVNWYITSKKPSYIRSVPQGPQNRNLTRECSCSLYGSYIFRIHKYSTFAVVNPTVTALTLTYR